MSQHNDTRVFNAAVTDIMIQLLNSGLKYDIDTCYGRDDEPSGTMVDIDYKNLYSILVNQYGFAVAELVYIALDGADLESTLLEITTLE